MADIDLLKGRRRWGPVTNLAAAGAANAVAVAVRSTFIGMQGTKNLKLKRLIIRNNAAPNTFVHIGTGVGAGVDIMPPQYSISNDTENFGEDQLPDIEMTGASFVAWPDAVGGGSLDVQIEVEER